MTVMKWSWEPEMTGKSKLLVTRYSRYNHKNVHSQVENSSHIKSNILSEKCKFTVKRISNTKSS